MLLDRWRARRAIASRTPPSTINDPADPRLFAAVEALKSRVDALESLGDPNWHYRWDGALQLVGLDATSRSVTEVRQRLVRLVHECDLRHMPRLSRRVLAVVLCQPREGEDLRGVYLRIDDDQGEVGSADWRAARRRIALLLMDGGGRHELFGGDRAIRQAVDGWAQARAGAS